MLISFVLLVTWWHIDYFTGWKGYFTSLDSNKKAVLREKYNFQKYQ